MSLSVFTDMYNHATGPAYLSGPSRIVNAAALRNYEISGRLFNNKKNVTGGTQIKETIWFTMPGLAGTYSPGEPINYQNAQAMKTLTADWRFVRTQVVANEKELELNRGGGDMFQQYKDVMESKLDFAMTELLTIVEKKFVATASNSNMEASSGKDPYSILCTVTSDGLNPSGFSTVQGLSRTTYANYRNQTVSYTQATPFDVDAGIVGAFDSMQLLLQLKPPTMEANRFENTGLSRHVIFTNREGVTDYKKAVRNINDLSPSNPDPHFQAVYSGIPLVSPDAYDTESVFSAGSPGYHFLNMDYIKWVGHSSYFFKRSPMEKDVNVPDNKVSIIDLWGNIVNTNPRASGYISAA